MGEVFILRKREKEEKEEEEKKWTVDKGSKNGLNTSLSEWEIFYFY